MLDSKPVDTPQWYRNLWYGDNAHIVVKQVQLPFNRVRFEYEWQGESNQAVITEYGQPVRIPHKAGAEFWLGHLNLIVVDFDVMSQTALVAHADGRGYQAFLARHFLYGWQHFQARLILTLYVWGLADYDAYAMPLWKHVHWGRKK